MRQDQAMPLRMLPVLTALAMALAPGMTRVHAQTGDAALSPIVIGGGGGTSQGGAFRVQGTFGQAASATLTGAGYRLQGGFWPAAAAPEDETIFADGFEGDATP